MKIVMHLCVGHALCIVRHVLIEPTLVHHVNITLFYTMVLVWRPVHPQHTKLKIILALIVIHRATHVWDQDQCSALLVIHQITSLMDAVLTLARVDITPIKNGKNV